MRPYPGQHVRVRSCCKVCPGRVGVVSHCLPGANPTLAAHRGGRWFVDLIRVNPKNHAPRTEILWGEELEPVTDRQEA